MTPGPLPPHERAWRHPSEIGAPPHEPTSRLGHFLIGSTAAIGLLLVGLLAISMTPKRYGDDDQVRVASSDGAATSFGLAAGAPSGSLTPSEHVLRAMSTIIAAQSRQNDGASTVAATFMADVDRPAVSDVTTSGETTIVATSAVAIVEATVLDPPDSAASAAIEAVDDPVDEGALPPSSEPQILADTTEPIESSTDPAATSDSTFATTSTSSTSTSSTSTSTTSTTTSTSTSTSTLPSSDSPKQFS